MHNFAIKALTAWILLGINFIISPRITSILIVSGLIILDFITGIIKAKVQGKARTSEGYRKTLKKVPGYIIVPTVLWMAGVYAKYHVPEDSDSAAMKEMAGILKSSSGWVLLFIIFIEVKSILENLNEIDTKSPFNKFFVNPLLKIMSFGLDNSPLVQAADKLKSQNKDKADKLLIDQNAKADKKKIDDSAEK